jgi:hypothetical protein
MEKLTRREIEEACNELQNALFEFLDLDEKETHIKLAKEKAHYRLNKAIDEVRELQVN